MNSENQSRAGKKVSKVLLRCGWGERLPASLINAGSRYKGCLHELDTASASYHTLIPISGSEQRPPENHLSVDRTFETIHVQTTHLQGSAIEAVFVGYAILSSQQMPCWTALRGSILCLFPWFTRHTVSSGTKTWLKAMILCPGAHICLISLFSYLLFSL